VEHVKACSRLAWKGLLHIMQTRNNLVLVLRLRFTVGLLVKSHSAVALAAICAIIL
jgi:hypothetical protein